MTVPARLRLRVCGCGSAVAGLRVYRLAVAWLAVGRSAGWPGGRVAGWAGRAGGGSSAEARFLGRIDG